MSDLKAYLAAKYMTGPKADAILARAGDGSAAAKKKRKKPKNEDYIGGAPSKTESTGGLVMKDEDEWKGNHDDLDMDGEDAPVIGKDVATFRKSKSVWSTVGASGLPVHAPPGVASDDMPEAGPSSARIDDGDAPDAEPAPPPVQITKRRGGLRTAAQLREEEERLKAERSPSPAPDEGAGAPDHTQTVHRDASGRIVDVEALKAEERKREEEERRKEKERDEWSKGLVQRQARDSRRREEADMRERDVARYADDVSMNQEMREVERWNDPAAEFISKKKKSKGPRRPKYQGAWAPNRFGIPPGFRWDGVDRSTGFEKKWFQAQNSAARAQYEHNQWSMEDM
ncbi:Pre-mRNA-splicing factor CWC26 [Saitozyma sp. JCM 24511]|nr:Pre-mRNA-splicing factor CWC26 [Saitozyma sp. JCM 24511]